MRWARMTVLALTAAGLVASAAPVSARALKVNRLPDALIDFCMAGVKCAPVAIGDFNGDGIDDAVFQENMIGSRSLYVLLGPFGHNPEPAIRLGFVPEDHRLAVDVADMNRDGQDELLVADISVREDEHFRSFEVQSVNVIDFNVLKAKPPEDGVHPHPYFIGRANAPFRWARTVPLKSALDRAGRVSVRAVDVNGDGGLDIVLGVDPNFTVQSSRGGMTAGAAPSGSARSEVIVQVMPRDFFKTKPGDLPDGKGSNGRPWPLNELITPAGQESVRITGLGACVRGGLAEVADVTGDGAPDIVVRRCEGGQLPDQLSLVAGRSSWPAAITIDGAIAPSSPPTEPGPPGRPVTPPEPPRGGGYLQIDPRGPGSGANIFDNLATFFTADLNGDGVQDIGFGQADKTHVWLGGSDLSDRLLADRSDRIFLGAGLGGAMANRSWMPTDLDGDGHRDLALTRLRSAAPTARDASGRVSFTAAPSEPLHVFARNREADDVIDVTSDAPDGIWSDASVTLWAFGDFNGDGLDDVMLGSPASAFESVYPVIYGPFLRR